MKAIGGSIAFLVLGGSAAILLLGGMLLALPALNPGTIVTSPPWWFPLIQGIVLILAFAGATGLIGFRWARLGREQLGLAPVSEGLRGFFRGLGIGAGPALLTMALAVPLGGATWLADIPSVGMYFGAAGRMGLALLPAAFSEEIIFRGVPLVLCAFAFGRSWAIGGVALLFAVAHLANPGLTPVAVINIALAGVMLGIVFFRPGRLWTATGAHLGWNLTLAALAAPVSGLPFAMPGLTYTPGGPGWLTGGAFGPEGGLLATLMLIGTIGALVARSQKESLS